MTAAEDRMRTLLDDPDRFIEEFKAQLPHDANGNLLCEKCNEIIPDGMICEPCRRKEDQKREVERRVSDVANSFRRSITSNDDLHNTVPGWTWARLDNLDFRSVVKGEILAAVEAWEPTERMMLCASTGAGKTSLLLARLYALHAEDLKLARAGRPHKLGGFLFCSGPDLASARRGHPLGKGEPRLVQRAMTEQLLILDEVGHEDMRDGLIFEIADARHKRGLVTVVTTGLDPRGFADRYGAACWRRFTEGGVVVDCFAKRPRAVHPGTAA